MQTIIGGWPIFSGLGRRYLRGGVRLIAGAFLGAGCLLARAQPLDVWTKTNPSLSSDDIADVTYVDGEFLAAAPTDGVLVSTDGTTWSLRPTEPAGHP
ncbi:MAG: hypothetical protein JWM99_3076, partial [Verrucomicrobiales bacterium]|nr:hypothetical protein [Verrucomicrobiales bacterium]